MKKRISFVVAVEPATKDQFAKFCEQTGMSKLAVGSRLYEWFTKQPCTVQLLIVNHFPGLIESDAAALFLKDLASKNPKQPAQT